MKNDNAIIRKSYMEIEADYTAREKPLSCKFAQMLNKKYDIDGNNLFIGICDSQSRGTLFGRRNQGFLRLEAGNQSAWKKIWNTLGIAEPGKLPSGAVALFYFSGDTEVGSRNKRKVANGYAAIPGAPHDHNGVDVWHIQRYFGPLGSTVNVGWQTHLEENVSAGPARESFAVAIVPKTIGGHDFSVSTGNYQSKVISDYLANSGTQPSAKKQPPQP